MAYEGTLVKLLSLYDSLKDNVLEFSITTKRQRYSRLHYINNHLTESDRDNILNLKVSRVLLLLFLLLLLFFVI